jgi:nucleoside-diphosphate-sugar epimerase
MSPKTTSVYSNGIYHGLPVFPDDPSTTGLTAIITGANGVSGYHMLQVLSQSPARWSKIYSLSRRPPAIPGGLPPNVEFISCDFLKGAEEVTSRLKAAGLTKVDYVFFCSYMQVPPKEGVGLWSDAEEMTRVNLALLVNFLEGLKATVGNGLPKRILLQTGAKTFG